MKISKIVPNHSDERGIITDILYNVPVEHVTIITSAKGVVRGNHYHRDTIQWVYLMSGKIESLTQFKGEEVVSAVLEPGDLIMTDRMERHALKALDDSVFLVFTRGPRGGEDYESDTYRLDEPLQKAD